jgi:hypothetical protein
MKHRQISRTLEAGWCRPCSSHRPKTTQPVFFSSRVTCRSYFPGAAVHDDDESLLEKFQSFVGKSNGDPGHWNYSPEWFGTQNQGWGRSHGDILFQKESPINGLVQVTGHPATSLEGKEEEWRVLRFNEKTRQSVARLQLHPHGGHQVVANCLAAEYLKTVAALFAAMIGLDFKYADKPYDCMDKEKTKFRVLSIGVGGGSLPLFLKHHFPGATIDAVEIDPAVIEAAERFMGFSCEARQGIHVHVQDAVDFVAAAQSDSYDIVYIDAFDGDDNIPEPLSTASFIKSIDRILCEEHAALIMNFHDDDTRGFEKAQAFAQTLHTPNGYCAFTVSCPTQGNFILCCSRSPVLAGIGQLQAFIKESASVIGHLADYPFTSGQRATRDMTVLY